MVEIRRIYENGRMYFREVVPEGEIPSRASTRERYTNLNGARVKTLSISAVATEPEKRRGGAIRQILGEINRYVEEEKFLITVMHPFSFSYYRKFGYERVADHRILQFPMSALDFAPRYNSLCRYKDEKMAKDLVTIYKEFIKGKNIVFERNETSFPIVDDKKTYILYDENENPKAYITLSVEKYLNVNRLKSVNLNVYEMCYSEPDDLMKLFGFMRMFEGELDSVKIHNCGMSPEVELMLRHYAHTEITLLTDLSARINNTAAVLEIVNYPDEPGEFTVKVTEPERSEFNRELTEGIFNVKYKAGVGKVTKLEDDAEYDFSCDIPAFTQLIYGYNSYGYEYARYTHNVVFNNPCSDFFRAFPNRPCGTYEHF